MTDSPQLPKPNPHLDCNSPVLCAVALLFLSFFPFCPALLGGFLWDDFLVTDNALLRTTGGLWKIWSDPYAMGERDPRYWPLLYTSFWLEHRIVGIRPFLYHFDNVALHCLNSILSWRILRRSRHAGAWTAAALFAVHPIHAETVAWIMERKGALSTFFFLAAFLAYLACEERPRAGWYLASIISYVCAYLSKPVTLTLPFALLIWFWWRRATFRSGLWFRILPFLFLGAVMGLFGVLTSIENHEAPISLTLPQRLKVAGRAFWFYCGKLAWPSSQMMIYPHWHLQGASFGGLMFVGAAGVLPIFLWLIRRRIGRGALAAVALYGLLLGPTLGIFPFGYMRRSFVADRYQYLASLAPLALAAMTASEVARRLPRGLSRVVHVLTAGCLLLMAPLSFAQSSLHRSAETLFKENARKNPRSAVVWLVLGNSLMDRQKPSEAADSYRRALALDPDDSAGHTGLGTALAEIGNEEGALTEFLAAERLNGENAENQLNLGLYHERHASPAEAIRHYTSALNSRPDLFEAHLRLGGLMESQGTDDSALAHYLEAERLDPSNHEVHARLGLFYVKRGRLEQAEAQFSLALHSRPNDPIAHFDLGVCYLEQGHDDEAARCFSRALELDPGFADARALLEKSRKTSDGR